MNTVIIVHDDKITFNLIFSGCNGEIVRNMTLDALMIPCGLYIPVNALSFEAIDILEGRPLPIYQLPCEFGGILITHSGALYRYVHVRSSDDMFCFQRIPYGKGTVTVCSDETEYVMMAQMAMHLTKCDVNATIALMSKISIIRETGYQTYAISELVEMVKAANCKEPIPRVLIERASSSELKGF